MQSDFRVETHTTGRMTTVTPSGELDLVTSPTLDAELERATRSDCDVIVVDLRPLGFMDSTRAGARGGSRTGRALTTG